MNISSAPASHLTPIPLVQSVFQLLYGLKSAANNYYVHRSVHRNIFL
jgi:hypothetical protein